MWTRIKILSYSKSAELMRLYLKSNSSITKFMWFHNSSANEMLIGISGLSDKQARLDGMFPKRKVSEDELKSLRFKYSDVCEVKERVDHITCHSDGTFHIKTINGGEVYRNTLQHSWTSSLEVT